MTSVCLYFQMHQPMRLRRYSVFDTEPNYFDTYRNAEILRKIAAKCYRPATELILEQIKKHKGKFRVSYSISGVLIDQLRRQCPEVIDLLVKLAHTGCVEFLSETYHHSLAFLYSREEFRDQVQLHAKLIHDLFGQTPRVFRNTELIYNNDMAHFVAGMSVPSPVLAHAGAGKPAEASTSSKGDGKYIGILAEGADAVLHGRLPTDVYRPPHDAELKILLRHYRLSDDIAFRFSNRNWSEWPLNAAKFVDWVGKLRSSTDQPPLCNLFMDYETFGEHQWKETGILDFLAELPGALLRAGHEFLSISQAMESRTPVDDYDVPHMISWADTERDLSAWLGNAMQSNALHELYKLEQPIKAADDPTLLEDWRRLNTSDHFYYMCTKYFADGDVHRYFNPYESPYDSYINFMNVLDNLRSRAGV